MSDGPSQPTPNQAYETPGNPADTEPAERARGQAHAKSGDNDEISRRGPGEGPSESQAVPTSMGRGVRGAGPGEEQRGMTQEKMDSEELDADQMGAPGEGRIASAVDRHPGASGNEPGLETDLDKKKAEQAPARKSVQQEEQKEFDVGGILGQRGGAANSVDKDNYPNSGS